MKIFIGAVIGFLSLTGIAYAWAYFPQFTIFALSIIFLVLIIVGLAKTQGRHNKSHLNLFSDINEKKHD